jgi:hypothetical protein
MKQNRKVALETKIVLVKKDGIDISGTARAAVKRHDDDDDLDATKIVPNQLSTSCYAKETKTAIIIIIYGGHFIDLINVEKVFESFGPTTATLV